MVFPYLKNCKLDIAPIFFGPTRFAGPNRIWDALLRLYHFIKIILSKNTQKRYISIGIKALSNMRIFFSKVSRPLSPARPSLLRLFSFILSKTFLFMSFHFRVFNYAEAFHLHWHKAFLNIAETVANDRPINITFIQKYSYYKGISSLFKYDLQNRCLEFKLFLQNINVKKKME